MGVGLMRSWSRSDEVFTTSRQSLDYITSLLTLASRYSFCPPSDAYVRSFLYLLYTLIKLYYTKALSDQASSLAPDWILLLQGPRILVYLRDSTTTFQNLLAMQETWVRSLGWEDPLEKGIATISSIRAWETPWTEELGRLPSMGSQRVRHD